MKKLIITIVMSLLISSNLYSDDFEDSQKACSRDHAYSCYEMGFSYDGGWDTKRDYKKAFKYFKKACSLGNQAGCVYLAGYYAEGKGTSKDLNKAIKLYEKYCQFINGEPNVYCGKVEKLKAEMSKSK